MPDCGDWAFLPVCGLDCFCPSTRLLWPPPVFLSSCRPVPSEYCSTAVPHTHTHKIADLCRLHIKIAPPIHPRVLSSLFTSRSIPPSVSIHSCTPLTHTRAHIHTDIRNTSHRFFPTRVSLGVCFVFTAQLCCPLCMWRCMR